MIFLVFLLLLQCVHLAHPFISTGKRVILNTAAANDDYDDPTDPAKSFKGSFDLDIIFDNIMPSEHYQTVGAQITSKIEEMGAEESTEFFGDLILIEMRERREEAFDVIQYLKTRPSSQNDESLTLTSSSLYYVDELIIPFKPASKPSNVHDKKFRPIRLFPQLTQSNLIYALETRDLQNFHYLLASTGPLKSSCILKFLQSTEFDLKDVFKDYEQLLSALCLPLRYLKHQEPELFREILMKSKYQPDDFGVKLLVEIIKTISEQNPPDCDTFTNLEAIFKTQGQILPFAEKTIFDLFLDSQHRLAIFALYFSLVPGTSKSCQLLGKLINREEKDQEFIDQLITSIPQLEVDCLVQIYMSPQINQVRLAIQAALYKKKHHLFKALLAHPQIDLNCDMRFVELHNFGPRFDWPPLPLHLHALLYGEFAKSFQIAFHPLYNRITHLRNICEVLRILFYLIFMKFVKTDNTKQ